MRLNKAMLVAAAALAACGTAQAQTKWDMPPPYSDGEFHTSNVKQFVEEVKKNTGGAPSGSSRTKAWRSPRSTCCCTRGAAPR